MGEISKTIVEALNKREATKEFIDKKISVEDFNTILESGRLSPSSFGWEPWKFLVVQNKEIREKLKNVSWGGQKQIPTASHLVLILGRRGSKMKYGSEYLHYISSEINKLPREIEEKKVSTFDSFKKNDFNLTTEDQIFGWVGKQCYIAMSNMMTVGALLGIDSCPMEGFNIAKVEEIAAEENLFDNSEFGIVAMVAFGYRKGNLPYSKTRRPLNEVVKWVK